jgi:hypothetical protein
LVVGGASRDGHLDDVELVELDSQSQQGDANRAADAGVQHTIR